MVVEGTLLDAHVKDFQPSLTPDTRVRPNYGESAARLSQLYLPSLPGDGGHFAHYRPPPADAAAVWFNR
eukprot:3576648-Prymnesium_polylepis.1